jgi:hypothetical protein
MRIKKEKKPSCMGCRNFFYIQEGQDRRRNGYIFLPNMKQEILLPNDAADNTPRGVFVVEKIGDYLF